MDKGDSKRKDGDDSSSKVAKWIDAHNDPVANIRSLSQCLVFSDIGSDGDYRLVLADFGDRWLTGNVKVKVFKGTSLVMENTLLDLPTAVVSIYMDTNEPRTPVIAVAAGPFIYVYKNLRPYYRFTMPELTVNQLESEVWTHFKEGRTPIATLIETLDSLKNQGVNLTSRSLCLLTISPVEQEQYASTYKDSPLKRQTVITCLETMKKSMADVDAISCLILGTESKQIYVLDPQAFTVLASMDLPSVPAFLDTSGLFDVEFTIIVACRNGGIYGLKRGSKQGRPLFELRSQPVGIKRVNKMIVVACMDDTIQCYSLKGRQQWCQKMPSSILAIELLDHKTKNLQAVLVALANNEVRVYVDKNLVDVIQTEDAVIAMKFGRFGREDSTLVLVTRGGGLMVKMLKRTALFEDKSPSIGPPAAQMQKMDIPRKTKLFLDQTVRERESGTEMYRQFQHDLYRMRLETARNYVGVLQKSMTPISVSYTDPVRLNVEVTGIGPLFKLAMHIQNTSSSQPSMDLCITFDYDNRLYAVRKPYITIPILVPGLNYVFDTFVQCLSEKGISDLIKVFVLKKNASTPLMTAVVNMPVSELSLA